MTNQPDFRKLLEEASGLPWEIVPDYHGNVPPQDGKLITIHFYDVDADNDGRACDFGHDICEMSDTKNDEANALLIVAAVNALPAHLARIAELEAAVREISRGVQHGVDPQVSIDRLVGIARKVVRPITDSELPTTEGAALSGGQP
jgi:serine phosphatase RsbU (regulator of sigma subunit)